FLSPSTPVNDVFKVNFTASNSPQSRSFLLTPVDDTRFGEPDEVATLSLAAVSDGRVVFGSNAQLIIEDDEGFGVIIVGFLDQEYTFFENGPNLALVQVGRNIDSGPAFRVEMTAAKPSSPSQFIIPSAIPSDLASNVTFIPNGNNREAIALDLRDDQTALEDDEFVTLTLSLPSASNISVGGTVNGVTYYSSARVTVKDNDFVTLGIDGTTSRSLFEGDSIDVCVSKDTVTARVVNFLLTALPGSAGPEDFSPITVQNGQLQRSSTSPVCFPFSAVEDSLSDDGESFSVALSSGDSFPTGPGGLQIGSDRVGVTILERIATPPSLPPGIIVEDTVIGDPLFTVPLPASAGHLCYEIRGVADQFFNFISDECVSVNAHYSERSPLPGETRQLHIIDQIAIRAVDNANDCINILVDRNGCVTTANRETISNAYNKGGVTVSAADNRVVVGVPNCGDLDLEMEVVCETRNGVEMIRFEVMRGHNLRDTSHGLLDTFTDTPVIPSSSPENVSSGMFQYQPKSSLVT
ncbi:hypothetical protein GBAR_LOCUS8848, partial [Geodia barretti]